MFHFKKLIDVWSLEDPKIRENKTEYIEIIETLDREYSVYGLNWQENRGISQLVNYQDSYLKIFDPQASKMSLQDGSSLTKNVRKWKNGLELTRNYTMFQKVSDKDPLPDIYLNEVQQPLIEIILFPDSGQVRFFLPISIILSKSVFWSRSILFEMNIVAKIDIFIEINIFAKIDLSIEMNTFVKPRYYWQIRYFLTKSL